MFGAEIKEGREGKEGKRKERKEVSIGNRVV